MMQVFFYSDVLLLTEIQLKPTDIDDNFELPVYRF